MSKRSRTAEGYIGTNADQMELNEKILETGRKITEVSEFFKNQSWVFPQSVHSQLIEKLDKIDYEKQNLPQDIHSHLHAVLSCNPEDLFENCDRILQAMRDVMAEYKAREAAECHVKSLKEMRQQLKSIESIAPHQVEQIQEIFDWLYLCFVSAPHPEVSAEAFLVDTELIIGNEDSLGIILSIMKEREDVLKYRRHYIASTFDELFLDEEEEEEKKGVVALLV